jgi:putative phosphoribosyl transferase
VPALNQTRLVPAAGASLTADIAHPDEAQGLVLFAHGSGSSRHSPRNRAVAAELQRAGLATVLVDLLTPAEEELDTRTGHLRFDIDLLAARLIGLTDWLKHDPATSDLGVGLFGASTGAAAALVTAAARPDTIRTVVSRGGRPDLAGEFLRLVHQPTLLIAGENDTTVIALNRRAMALLGGPARLEIVPGATHLFTEPDALETVAQLARDWFVAHLTQGDQRQPAPAHH